jgi:hypothetical protein
VRLSFTLATVQDKTCFVTGDNTSYEVKIIICFVDELMVHRHMVSHAVDASAQCVGNTSYPKDGVTPTN